MSYARQSPVRPRVRRQPLPFAAPDIDEEDIAGVAAVMRSGWLTTGQKAQEFEEAFAHRLGVKHAIALTSATAALHLALDAIGLQRGDEVIVPTLTFTATAEVVRYLDATPVLVDVAAGTLCIDPDAVLQAITPRTRAIMAVHLGGHPASMDALLSIAHQYNLKIIEDAAHAFPCSLGGRPAGTLGHLGAFSFYPTKSITTGEGGMLVTDDPAYAKRARVMMLHGMSRDSWRRYGGGAWRYDVIAPGFKYNMTDMAAVLGLSQLRKSDAMWQRRCEIAVRYSAIFGFVPELEAPRSYGDIDHAWHLYILRLHTDQIGISRDAFIEELSRRGIHTSVHFIPLHTFTYYRQTYGYHDDCFPVAMREFERMLSLPIYSSMTDGDIEDVIDAVLDVVEAYR